MAMKACSIVAAILAVGAPALGADAKADLNRGMGLFRAGRYDEALTALGGCADAEGKPAGADRALYTIAAIHRAQGRHADADRALERLVGEHPQSPWSLNGHAMLAARAADAQTWDLATQHTVRFLDLYLTRPYATIDDRVSGAMFDALVEYAQHTGGDAGATKQAGGKPLLAIYRALADAYPPSTGAGRVIAFRVPVDVNDPQANLVVNPGFELDGRGIGTPVGWRCGGTEPDDQDDLDGTIETGTFRAFVQARSGQFVAGKFTGWGRHQGWLFQRVAVLAGKRYDVTAWGMTPGEDERVGAVRLGVDATGNTDPSKDTVQWTEPVSSREKYVQMTLTGEAAVTATSGEGAGPTVLTVFLELRQDAPSSPNAMLFDDVAVRQAK